MPLSTENLNIRGVLPEPMVAIIGTRAPSPEAEQAAYTVATMLARLGIGVVSGLARGIDGAAHRGCLAGGGATAAVLGHGLERPIYPPEHAELAQNITINGALVSPFAADVFLSRTTLLQRNRYIVTLARAVWVVQTGVPGGALSAVATARKYGIPVLTSPWDEECWHLGYAALMARGAESVDVLTAAVRLAEIARRPIAILQQEQLEL